MHGFGVERRETRFREMMATEFVRRFRRSVTHDQRSFVWMLGAGCSVSSGVSAAADCCRAWIKELKYLETGSSHDVEGWATTRFMNYNPDDPASVYGDVLAAMFHQPVDRRRAVEALTGGAEPGFGYATLAQLMTHPNWGAHTGLALTTNFDDMLAEALHVYSQKRPQTIAQEALSQGTPLFPDTPTVLKLYGDAHLPSRDRNANRPRYREDVRDRLREILSDVGLIIVGYGGREEAFLDMLEGLPPGGPGGGVYWVNEHEPQGAFGDWLESVGAVWVQHSDFDQLMYYMRVEFGLGHPKIDRFRLVFRKYNAQYRDLLTRSGLRVDATPQEDGGESEPEAIAPLEGGPSAIGGDAPEVGAQADARRGVRRRTNQSQSARLRQSFRAYASVLKKTQEDAPERPPNFHRGSASEVNDLLNAAQAALSGSDKPRDAGADPFHADPFQEDRAASSGKFAQPTRRLRRSDVETVLGKGDGASLSGQEARPRQTDAGDRNSGDRNSGDGGGALIRQSEVFRRGAGANASEAPQDDERGAQSDARSLRADPPLIADQTSAAADGASAADRTADLARIGKRLITSKRQVDAVQDADGALPPEPHKRLPVSQASYGEASLLAALEDAPSDAALRARYARFLAVGVGDVRRAEAVFEQAQQSAPSNVSVLRDYASFAFNQLRDVKRAERLFAEALHHDIRNAETLRRFADFLVRGNGDLDEAENCLRLAVEVQADNPRNFIEYAEFLLHQRGRPEDAEAQLRRGAEIRPESAAALAALAVFKATVTRELDAAQQALARAGRIAADDPEVAFARAAIAERKGDLDDAEAHYRRAAEGRMRDVRAILAYAEFLHRRRGDLDGAEGQLRSAMEIAPYRAAPFVAYGRFLSAAREQPEAAERALREAVAAEPYDAPALCALAEHLTDHDGDADEAEELFKDALAMAPRSAETLRAFGRFLADVRDDESGAEAQYRAAIEIDPHDAENFDALATFMHEVRHDAEEAEVFFRQALKLAPNRTATLDKFAGFLRDTKRSVDEAETFYRRALDANPRDAQSLARSAQFLLSKGRKSEGMKVLNDAFDAAWRIDPAVRPASLTLELWIYRYAHDQGRRDESLRAAIALIEAGVRCEGWDLTSTVREAISAGHPDPDIVQDLAAVATQGVDPSRLLRRA
ncbi:MAG: tetratricopeptide repeat protein [Pseudomonadota bacterium]